MEKGLIMASLPAIGKLYTQNPATPEIFRGSSNPCVQDSNNLSFFTSPPQAGGMASYRNLQVPLGFAARAFAIATEDSGLEGLLIGLSLQPTGNAAFWQDNISSGPSANGFLRAAASGFQGFLLQDAPSVQFRQLVRFCSPVSKVYLSWNLTPGLSFTMVYGELDDLIKIV